MEIPLFNLESQHAGLNKNLEDAASRVLKSGCYILGEEVASLEHLLASMIGAKHGIAASSGTDALLLALLAFDIGPGDEVLCPVFSFFATASVIARLGATPVWVDISEADFNIDPEDAARKITPNSKAIIPVHLFGQSAKMEPIMSIAQEHGLKVIEDNAQSLGARQNNQYAGTIGDLGCTSFYPTKNLGGFGEGGLIFTNNDALEKKVRILRNHGCETRYKHIFLGGNFRLDALQGALLKEKFPYLNQYIKQRRKNADYYNTKLSHIKGIILPTETGQNYHTWNQYTIRVKDNLRSELQNYLKGHSIGSEVYYPETLDRQPCFSYIKQFPETLKVAYKSAQEVLSLPIYPELPRTHQDKVIHAIQDFFEIHAPTMIKKSTLEKTL